MITSCPGAAMIKATPSLDAKHCPECGREIELFSSEAKSTCPRCGFVVYNDMQACVNQCGHAEECMGIEQFNQHKKGE